MISRQEISFFVVIVPLFLLFCFNCVVPLLQHLTLTANRWNQLDSHNILFNVSSIILFHFKKFISQFLTEERQRDRNQKGNSYKHFLVVVIWSKSYLDIPVGYTGWKTLDRIWHGQIRPQWSTFTLKCLLKRLKNESNLTSRCMERTFEWMNNQIGMFFSCFFESLIHE